MDLTNIEYPVITPYGGRLVNLVVPEAEAKDLASYAGKLPSLQLSARSLCDLELLAVGAFSPLNRFMGQAGYERVLTEMRLADGTLFPIPITLPATSPAGLERGQDIALRNLQNELIAVMTLEEIYSWDRAREATQVFGSTDERHPLVAEMQTWGNVYVSGRLRVVHLPRHYDFIDLRRTPSDVRDIFARLGYSNIVAFQTRNPIHRAHEELTKRAAAAINGALLIHPVIGMTKPGDIDHYTRVRIYKVLVDTYYDAQRTVLSLLPLAMRMAGPREAFWHAIIRRNYGATHFIVGRDHAGPGADSAGQPFYDPYDAQRLLVAHAEELGIEIVPFRRMVYLPEQDEYRPEDEVPAGSRVLSISGTELRRRLDQGDELPSWFTPPEVAAELRRSYPPRAERGFTVFLTGLSGSGKSTVAARLRTRLLEHAGRPVSLLDGDIVRRHLSPDLGFSREDRDR